MSNDFLIKRHLAKTMTWRIVGSIDTMLIGWLVSGNPLIGLSIGGTEVITKMIFYFVHERLWLKIDNRNHDIVYKYRHIIKTISWRIIGTIDTTLLAWLIAGDPLIGLQIGGYELFTKMILYYFHERVWHKYDFGVENNKENDE
jgi:uncharacterized membrane protein